MLRLETLTLANFDDYVTLTACGDDGKPCYCSFWHLKVGSMADYDAMKARDPLALREIVRSKVQAGFHVGVLAYDDEALVAWISVGPLPEVYWCWRRVASLGVETAQHTAGVTCVTVGEAHRKKGLQRGLASALATYGSAQGWNAIEAYPFDDGAIEKTPKLAWAGYERPFADAGFERVGSHWLSRPGYERWIYRRALGE